MRKITLLVILVFLLSLTSCTFISNSKSATKKRKTMSISTKQDSNYEYVSLITDKKFKRGFELWGLGLPIYGDAIELYGGEYEKKTDIVFDHGIEQEKEPVWKLQQWATRYPFHDKNNTVDSFDYKFTDKGEGVYLYENRSKTVEVNTKTSEFRLALKASECYVTGEPRVAGQEWPHLLLTQDFGTAMKPKAQMKVSNSSSLKFHIEMKMNSFIDNMGDEADPGLHSGMCIFYLFISRLPSGYSSYTDMLNLGIELFDNRVACQDKMSFADSLSSKGSATGKWIYNIDMNEFLDSSNNIWDSQGNFRLDEWFTVDFEVLPFIEEAITEAQDAGYMANATMDELYISGMYIGFELPGNYDIDMSFRNMDVSSLIEVN